MKLVTMSLIGLLVASPLLAQEPAPQDRQHVVKEGDTLWDLAGSYLSNPFRWRIIYEANTGVVEDPHWIYPEEVLLIPGLVSSVEGVAEVPGSEPVVAVRPLDRPLRTVFYRPDVERPEQQEEPTLLMEPGLETLPVRPGEFAAAEFLADPSRMGRFGRMIKPKREMTRLSGVSPTAHPKDEVYLTNQSDVEPTIGERALLVEVGRGVRGAGGGQRMIRPTAVIEVLDVTPDVIKGRVARQFATVGEDQLLVPMEPFPEFSAPGAEPVEGGADLRGRILEFVDEQQLYGRADRAFVDLGSVDGVSVGDVLLAYLPERTAREGVLAGVITRPETLPPEAVAELRVVRVTEYNSTVVVDRLLLPELHEGMWVQRIRKMP